MCRIIDSPRANGSGSSIPFGLALSRKRPAPPDRYAIPEKPHRSGPKRNPSPASERSIVSATLPLTCALARWGFRFARLLSRVNAWPFRFVTLLRVIASVFWQNGMEMRLSLITASRSTRAPTISPSSTPRTLTMCRIIDSPRANGSGSSIPFGRQPHPLTRKRAQQQPRRTVTRKGMRSKRNPSPASERSIVSATLPLTCALARWRFRFAGLLSRANAWPFRFISLLRVNASVFWQNGMEMRLSLIRT